MSGTCWDLRTLTRRRRQLQLLGKLKLLRLFFGQIGVLKIDSVSINKQCSTYCIFLTR